MPRPMFTELERAEVEAYVDMCREAPRGSDDPWAEATRVGGATALVATGLAPQMARRVLGLGVGAPATSSDVDAVLDWMAKRADGQYVVALAPDARPGRLYESLLARGFVPGRPWMKFHRLAADPLPTLDSSCRVRRAEGQRDAIAFADLVAESFGVGETFAKWIMNLVGRPGWDVLLAADGNEILGAGALHSGGALGWLGFGATARPHRQRRVHRTLLCERIRLADRRGVRSLAVETGVRVPGEPDPCYRNLLWAGFEEAYVRPNLMSPALHRARVAKTSAA